MINNFYEYFLGIVINILDIGMVYYLVHNIVNPRNKWLSIEERNKRLPLTPKVLAFGLVYGVVVGYFGYLFTDEVLFRLVGIVVVWLIIKWMTNERWGNVIIMYTIMFLVLSVVQVLITIPIQLMGEPTILGGLVMQAVGFTLCVVLYKKISLYQLFIFVKNKLSGIYFFILTPFIASLSVAYFLLVFEGWYLLIPATIGVTTVIGIYQLIKYSKKLNAQLHDTESVYEGLDYLLKTEDDMEEIKKDFADTLKRIEFEIPKSNFQPGKHEENIIEYIDNKKVARNAKMEIIKNVNFYWKNRKVSSSMVIHMLGTLLNNAFETKVKKPLFVDVTVAGHELEIMVSNASDNKSYIEVSQMFDAGSSNKKGDRGYGLPNLLKIVESYGGDIAIDCHHKPEYKSHYLTLTIRIKEFN